MYIYVTLLIFAISTITTNCCFKDIQKSAQAFTGLHILSNPIYFTPVKFPRYHIISIKQLLKILISNKICLRHFIIIQNTLTT